VLQGAFGTAALAGLLPEWAGRYLAAQVGLNMARIKIYPFGVVMAGTAEVPDMPQAGAEQEIRMALVVLALLVESLLLPTKE
jgi:hypothetical protein